MARVTVEDCIDKVDNRFDLVLLASHRSRAIANGAPLTIERDSDRTPVVALREIAEETISPSDLREGLIHSLQKYVEVDEPDPDTLPVVPATVDALAADGDAESYERISEEDLLRGMENLVPPDRADDL